MSTPTRSTPFTLTQAVADDAAGFARLLAGAYTVPADVDARKPLADTDLAARLDVPVSAELGLADWAMVRLAPEESLNAYQYGMLDAAERIVAAFLAAPAFHPALAEALKLHRGVLAAAALPADGWITNPQHPARRLLACFHSLACGWHPELGATAESVRAQMESWLTRIARRAQSWEEVAGAATTWLEDEQRRVERLTKRLIDAESGALRTRRARVLAARTLNQALVDRLIGTEVAAVLREDWFAAMQWILVSEGENGPLWQRMKRVTGTLRWTLSPEISEENRNKLYRIVGQVNEDIEALAPLVIHDEAARDRVTSALGAEHLRILRNEARETVPFAPVDGQDALADGSTALSDNLLARVRDLAPGQWLLFNDAGVTRRIRLLLKQDDTHQLLFVNALGIKALSTSWEAFALRLANGDAEPLPLDPPLAASILGVIGELTTRQQRAQQDRMEAIRTAREHAAADARIKEAARQKAIAEAQALEAARHESQRKAAELQRDVDLAQAQVQREAEQVRRVADETARITEQQRAQRARLMASSLTIGAWIAFRAADGSIEKRRLTVILPSSGKYIFVDAEGTGKREVMRDELVRGLGDGSIALLNKDQRLDDALTRVVDNLRHERGHGGQG